MAGALDALSVLGRDDGARQVGAFLRIGDVPICMRVEEQTGILAAGVVEELKKLTLHLGKKGATQRVAESLEKYL